MNVLYQTQFFASYQSDTGRCFYIDFGHKTVKMSLCQLLAFRQQVKTINLESHFNGVNQQGIEILSLCNREHIFVFGTVEVVDLKKLISGTFAILELNSLITAPL